MSAIREVKTISGRRGPRREHEHDEHSLALVWRGSTEALVEGSRRAVRAGQVALIAAGASHECSPRCPEEWGYTLLLVEAGSCGLLDAALAGAKNGLLVLDAPQTEALALACAAEMGPEEAAMAAIDDLLAHSSAWPKQGAATRAPRSRSPGIAAAEALMRSSLNARSSLDRFAKVAEMDRFGFARAFKAGYGLSPHAYLLNLRVNEAKAKLRSGETIVETALECGFCDQSHFTRVFERTVGLSPAAYLREARGLKRLDA